jgi:hypothetical protein
LVEKIGVYLDVDISEKLACSSHNGLLMIMILVNVIHRARVHLEEVIDTQLVK